MHTCMSPTDGLRWKERLELVSRNFGTVIREKGTTEVVYGGALKRFQLLKFDPVAVKFRSSSSFNLFVASATAIAACYSRSST